MSSPALPRHVGRDQTLRVKIIDACGLTCTFCHNEGTPVTIDNQRRPLGEFTSAGTSGRMSIYAETNGAAFLPAPMSADGEFGHVLGVLRDALDLSELHLTGGEPTVHPAVAKLVRIGVEQGYAVRMTSNGENGANVFAACAEAGLSKVNFSIFGTTAAELAEVQHARYQNAALATRKIEALRRSIQLCVVHGIQANANIVVPDVGHAPRVHRLLDDYAPELSVRLLNALEAGQASIQAIHGILVERGAVPEARYITAGVSGARTAYRLPDGRTVFFKEIRPVRLPDTCAGCRFHNGSDCHEGFYGVRLYRDRGGRYLVGVCIQRMDLCLPVEEFVRSPLRREILRLRHEEYEALTAGQPANVPTNL
jgi:molybdenum cofactor biosynthesis enzyme MoaA